MASTSTLMHDAIDALQALHRTVAGVQTAPALATYPTVIDTAMLPCLIVWPTQGQWYVKGGAERQMLRTFSVIAYVEPLGQNTAPTRAVQAIDLLQRLINTYTDVANIPLAGPPPYQLTIESAPERQHSDGGLQSDLAFGGRAFHGFVVSLNVRAVW